RQYRQMAQPALDQLKEMREVSMIGSGAMTFVVPLIVSDPYPELMKDVKSISALPKESVNGVPCTPLVFKQDPVSVKVWMSDEAHPRVVRAEPDMAGLFKKMKEEGQAGPDK